MNDLTELEVELIQAELMQAMVKLMVHVPDGVERIQTCLSYVVQAGIEILDKQREKHEHHYH